MSSRSAGAVQEAVLHLLEPDADGGAVARAHEQGPDRFGPSSPELLRFAWASAVLEAHPGLLRPWALSDDRAVRRAVMRSPGIDLDVIERVVSTRRSGIHTLGSNPATPGEMLEHNPSARRRLDGLRALEPGGIASIDASPNRRGLIEAASPTVDLVLARSDRLDHDHAALLASRSDPAIDPWVAAVLAARFGGAVAAAFAIHASRARLAAALAMERPAGWYVLSRSVR